MRSNSILSLLGDDIAMLATGSHGDPFRVLGLHLRPRGAGYSVRVMDPDAVRVRVEAEGRAFELMGLGRGFFYGAAAWLAPGCHYRLRITDARGERVVEDPYRFGLVIGPEDAIDLKAGRCWHAHHILGARPITLSGIQGLAFAVWAPLARQVAVVGAWNRWDFRARPMRFRHEIGVWEFFEPGLAPGAAYCFDILAADGQRLRRRDPLARALAPADLAVALAVPVREGVSEQVAPTAPARRETPRLVAMIAPPPDGDVGHRAALVDSARDLGFTDLWFSQVMESGDPFALMCPSAAWGKAAGLATLTRHAQASGLGIVLDWRVSGFPVDPHGLAGFDGSCLYENSGLLQETGVTPNRLRFNFARYEVANFLVCALLDAIERFGFDAIVFRGVGEILRWPVLRGRGEPGDREVDPAAVDFLRCQNEVLAMRAPGVERIACEGIGWPGLAQPGHVGGLGFDLAGTPHWGGLLGDDAARALALAALPHARSFIRFDPVAFGPDSGAGDPADRVKGEMELALALFLALPGMKAVPLDLAQRPRLSQILRWFAVSGPQGRDLLSADQCAGPQGVVVFSFGEEWIGVFNPAQFPRELRMPEGGGWQRSATFGARGDKKTGGAARGPGVGHSADLPGRSFSLWQRVPGPASGFASAASAGPVPRKRDRCDA